MLTLNKHFFFCVFEKNGLYCDGTLWHYTKTICSSSDMYVYKDIKHYTRYNLEKDIILVRKHAIPLPWKVTHRLTFTFLISLPVLHFSCATFNSKKGLQHKNGINRFLVLYARSLTTMGSFVFLIYPMVEKT